MRTTVPQRSVTMSRTLPNDEPTVYVERVVMLWVRVCERVKQKHCVVYNTHMDRCSHIYIYSMPESIKEGVNV